MRERISLKLRIVASLAGVLTIGALIATSQEALNPPRVHQRLATSVTDPVAREVLRIEEARVNAVANKEITTLERFLSSDFVVTSGRGSFLTRRNYLDLLQTLVAPREMAHEQVRIRMYGDTAIITGIGNTTLADGTVNRSRYTHVWVKQRGDWRLAAMHISNIEPSDGGR